MSRQLVNHIGTSEQDNLINSLQPPALAFGVLLRPGQGELKRGTVLGRSSIGDYVILGTAEDSDETITANCILSDPVNTDEDDHVGAIAYRTGHMNRNALIVAEGYIFTEDDEEELRKGGILLSDAKR